MDIDLTALPIPDWGLECPRCRYPLKGLPTHRCPECGLKVAISELVQSWTRLRPPRFTGGERPLPDFGLVCIPCNRPLTGAPASVCPGCGEPFDLERVRPQGEWFVLPPEYCGGLSMNTVQVAFAQDHLPYMPLNEKSLTEIYGGHNVLYARLRIPTEFFFDALWLIQETRREIQRVRALGGGAEWKCPHCGEENPANFEICWKCERSRNRE